MEAIEKELVVANQRIESLKSQNFLLRGKLSRMEKAFEALKASVKSMINTVPTQGRYLETCEIRTARKLEDGNIILTLFGQDSTYYLLAKGKLRLYRLAFLGDKSGYPTNMWVKAGTLCL